MKDNNKRNLTPWEKTAIVIIVILIFVIVVLIFRDQIEKYIEVFINWYRSEN